jgi:putative transposase
MQLDIPSPRLACRMFKHAFPLLKQGNDGVRVFEIYRKAGISQATYFNWKKKYDGLLPTEMRRLRQLKDENAS